MTEKTKVAELEPELAAALQRIDLAKEDYAQFATYLNTFRLLCYGMRLDPNGNNLERHLISMERLVLDCETWIRDEYNKVSAPLIEQGKTH